MHVEINEKTVNDKKILSNIELTLDKCGFVFITGKSGSGKTTLLNIMAGNDLDYEGKVVLTDNITAENEDYRKNVDVINQDYNLIASLNVKDNIMLLRPSQFDFQQI